MMLTLSDGVYKWKCCSVRWVKYFSHPIIFFSFIEVSDIWPLSLNRKMAFQLFSQKNKAPSSLVVKLVIHSLDKYFNHSLSIL